jgi:hypothetical protein
MKKTFNFKRLVYRVETKSQFTLVSVLLTVILCGCNSKYYDATIQEEAFAKNNKAIVILKTLYSRNCLLSCNDADQLPVQTDWAKLDQSYDNKETRVTYDFDANDRLMRIGSVLAEVGTMGLSTLVTNEKRYYAAYMIDPGKYVLDHINLSSGGMRYYSIVEGWDKSSKQPHLASFEVQPGEVVYLGDLKIMPTMNTFAVMPVDHYNDAVTFFKEKYPQITTAVIKRLVTPRSGASYMSRD